MGSRFGVYSRSGGGTRSRQKLSSIAVGRCDTVKLVPQWVSVKSQPRMPRPQGDIPLNELAPPMGGAGAQGVLQLADGGASLH